MCCATRERDKPPLFSSAKWLGKFNPKLQAFKRVLDLIFKYEEIEGAGVAASENFPTKNS